MLKQLQDDFYQDILTPIKAKNYLDNGRFNGKDLIQIYHNQYFSSLKESLAKSYACVKRLVGEDFFNLLAKQYIDMYPPKTGSIIDYGNDFADFIKTHSQCSNFPYLFDMAKFERLYEKCYFSLTNKFYMHSNYPLIKIWQLDENSEQLDLSSDGDYLKIYKHNTEVVIEKITKHEYDNE